MSFALLDRVRLRRVVETTSFRLAALFAALLVVAFAVAGIGAWGVTRGIAEQQVRERLALEMGSMAHEVRDEGLQAAMLAIESRASRPGALAYRLVGPDGGVLAGDLPVQLNRPGWRYLDLPDRSRLRHGQDDLVVLTSRLGDGSMLSIGGDLERGESVRIGVLRALFWVGLVSAAVAVMIGLWITRRALGRMDALSATLSAVADGDLTVRTALRSPPRDDLDHLAGAVNTMIERLATLVANVRRVSTDVAHDLRTPLSHLRHDLERAASAPPAEFVQHIGSAQGRIDELLRIFDAMLRLAEIEAGAARARFAPVDLRALVERVADAYRPDVEVVGGVLLARDVASVIVDGDADLLAQALANLIENALLHGGSPPRIEIVVSAEQGGVVLAVCDSGPGIHRRDHARALEPFVRLDVARSTPGSGLGLAIVAAVARLHGTNLVLQDGAPGLRATMIWREARVAAARAVPLS